MIDFFEQVVNIRGIGGNDLKVIKEIGNLIKRYNPDIVYAHSNKVGAIARVTYWFKESLCIEPIWMGIQYVLLSKEKGNITAIEK